MSTVTHLAVEYNRFLAFAQKLRSVLTKHPEYLAWFFSVCVWIFLVVELVSDSQGTDLSTMIYCGPTGTVNTTAQPVYEIQHTAAEQSVPFKIGKAVLDGLPHWILMLAAMMFPLLNEPVKHVAFSVRRKDRGMAVLLFLTGYTLMWTAAGTVFLLLPVFLDVLIADQAPVVRSVIMACSFLVPAVLVCLPARATHMMKCSQTKPIRIRGWQSQADCLSYGIKMGSTCLNMCWAAMAALVLAHHNLVFMLLVTAVLIYERYFLPHTSKRPAYAWAAFTLVLVGLEAWS